jgi:two-component system cell cycle response regulator
MMDVLFAGADAEARTFLESHLPEWGFRLETTANGWEALRVLKGDATPRLVILEEDLPGVGGLGICETLQMHEAPPHLYAFVLPAKGRDPNVREVAKAGADYLRRPLNAWDLQVRLNAARRTLRLEQTLAQSAEGMHFLSSHDSLTGVWNRAAILDLFQREFVRAQREGTRFGLIMVGVDHFRKILESRGERAGDAVLRGMARRILPVIRPYDMAGRFGENEFLLVLPGCGQEDVSKIASRLHGLFLGEHADITDEASEELVSQPREERIPVTLSLGVFSSDQLTDADALLKGVREAFHRAKRQGGNRIVEAFPAAAKLDTPQPAPGFVRMAPVS